MRLSEAQQTIAADDELSDEVEHRVETATIDTNRAHGFRGRFARGTRRDRCDGDASDIAGGARCRFDGCSVSSRCHDDREHAVERV